MNLSVLDDYEDTCADFRLKRRRLECVEKGETSKLLEDERALCIAENRPAVISIDFYMLLAVVIARFKVPITNVEYVHLVAQSYKACLSVVTPNDVTEARWIQSGRCSSVHAAKQTLAKKALQFLKPIYQFEVEDVNYHMLQYSSVLTMLERESYLTIKERIHGIKVDSSANAVLGEEAPVTPRGVEFQIPAALPLPRPPKKQRPASASRSFADVVPDAMMPAPLESVFQHRNST